jgi:hypothetical protein
LNPDRRGGKPATNRFSYGAALDESCRFTVGEALPIRLEKIQLKITPIKHMTTGSWWQGKRMKKYGLSIDRSIERMDKQKNGESILTFERTPVQEII